MIAAESLDPAWAWAPFQPDAQRPWDLRLAGHLYRRAAFGGTWAQLQQAVADGPQTTVAKLLRGGDEAATFQQSSDALEAAAIDPGATSAETLREWWLRRMLQTPHPLLEKMVLLWHGHFGTGNARVQSPQLMQRYVQLLRRHALGRFSSLLAGVVRDPATLMSLELGVNTATHVNDALARALLECFTLGPGRYSEQDVQETARALTGWSVVRRQLRYVAEEHDDGPKRLFGQEGRFGDDVVGIVLRQPGTPRFVVGKLYRWLICDIEEPDDRLLAPLVESFAKDDDAGKLVETMLRSNLFFSPRSYRRRIKSPVELVLGLARPLEALIPTRPLGSDLAALGQDLCQPPTVHGWEGGRAWITTATLVGRNNLAAALLANAGRYGGKLDPLAVARRHGNAAPEAAGKFLLDLWLQGDVAPAVRDALLKASDRGKTSDNDAGGWLREVAHAITSLPDFHLA